MNFKKGNGLVWILGLVSLITYHRTGYTQGFIGIEQKKISTTSTIFLDPFSIVKGSESLSCNDSILPPNTYKLDYTTSTLTFLTRPPCDSVHIRYQRYAYSFSQSYVHKKLEEYVQPTAIKDPFKYELPETPSLFSESNIYKQGSISRGIRFGNAQDISVNSNLNLQLDGDLSKDLKIKAAITDQNIPIQPDGNTAQLQDFDQVYIQLYNNTHALTAGDFLLSEKEHYFMRYLKKAQGIHYQGKNLGGQGWGVRASAGASRGKFARQILAQTEGKQGPYVLLGAEREAFIIVLSGTEKVFIDGELLTRGTENDYVIDYNTAQITFTPNRPITKDKRVVIEFQYTDQNYARVLSDVGLQYQKDSLKGFIQFFTEQDLKNQSINSNLSDQKKIFLAGIGDNLNQAFYPSGDSVGYSTDRVLYKKIDSLGYAGIYVFSNDPNAAFYAVNFSNVGAGMGNYILLNNGANGKTFAWVSPDTIGGQIIRQGTYAPIELLRTPKQKQMLNMGLSQQWKQGFLKMESALSKDDLNTFSALDAGNDYGMASTLKAEKNIQITKQNNLKTGANYEFINRNFQAIEWFRNPEFLRDWNLTGLTLTQNQHLYDASAGLAHRGYGNWLTYTLKGYTVEQNQYKALKHQVNSDFNYKETRVQQASSYLSTQSLINSSFIRNKSIVSTRISPKYTLGIKDDIERNLFTSSTNDSLLANAYQFIEWEAFLQYTDSSTNSYTLSYIQRSDQKPLNGQLLSSTYADNIVLSTQLWQGKSFTLKTKSTYRNLKIRNPEITTDKPQETILNRIEYSYQYGKGFISHNSFYELGSGFESKKEFVYVQVNPGQGNYTWIDYNNSGTQELGEFEPSIFQDQANYIRVLAPSTEFIRTKNNQFSSSFFIQPHAVLKSKKGLGSIVAKFSNQVSYQIDWKSTAPNTLKTINPFGVNLQDTALFGLNSAFRNSLFFNQNSPIFALSLNSTRIGNKLLSNNGFEYRSNRTDEILMRLKLSTPLLFELKTQQGNKIQNNEFFSIKNFNIKAYEIEPKISYQPGTKTRFTLSYLWNQKQNNPQFGAQKSSANSLSSVMRYSNAGKSHIEASITYTNINFQSNEPQSNTSPIAYEMLQGLSSGKNYLWSLNYQKTIKENTQLSLQYNGRSAPLSKVVHTAGAEVRIFF